MVTCQVVPLGSVLLSVVAPRCAPTKTPAVTFTGGVRTPLLPYPITDVSVTRMSLQRDPAGVVAGAVRNTSRICPGARQNAPESASVRLPVACGRVAGSGARQVGRLAEVAADGAGCAELQPAMSAVADAANAANAAKAVNRAGADAWVRARMGGS